MAFWGTGTRSSNFTSIGPVTVATSCRTPPKVTTSSSKTLALGVGIGVGAGVPLLIILVVVVILMKKRKSSKQMTELTGKTATERRNDQSPNGNKVVPTAEHSADENDNKSKHTPLGSYKQSEPSLTSATMLTNPDVTTDEVHPSKKGKPSQFKSAVPSNHQSKK